VAGDRHLGGLSQPGNLQVGPVNYLVLARWVVELW
jgi:hypothetical protein